MTCWKPRSEYLATGLPRGLIRWLLDPASLTLRLQQLCGGRFRVRVLDQAYGRPTRDEAQALGMRTDGLAIIRQVHLLCGNVPWIYARTVIPVTSLRGRLRRLATLGTRPLGGMLFADPGMQRGAVELACITAGSDLHAVAVRSQRRKSAVIWGRRSVFRITGLPLLVSEVFLPSFPADKSAAPRWKSR